MSSKGFTLLETVVAIAIIVIISTCAFGISLFLEKQAKDAGIKRFLVNESEAYAVCYKNAVGEASFDYAKFKAGLEFYKYSAFESFGREADINGDKQITITFNNKSLVDFAGDNAIIINISANDFNLKAKVGKKVIYTMPTIVGVRIV